MVPSTRSRPFRSRRYTASGPLMFLSKTQVRVAFRELVPRAHCRIVTCIGRAQEPANGHPSQVRSPERGVTRTLGTSAHDQRRQDHVADAALVGRWSTPRVVTTRWARRNTTPGGVPGPRCARADLRALQVGAAGGQQPRLSQVRLSVDQARTRQYAPPEQLRAERSAAGRPHAAAAVHCLRGNVQRMGDADRPRRVPANARCWFPLHPVRRILSPVRCISSMARPLL